MDDASCGSNNAFKGLSRHLEQDRSHQQDRFTAPQQAASNFRSQQFGPGASNEFAAFQQQGAALPSEPLGAPQFHQPSQFHPAARAPAFAPYQPPQQTAAPIPNARSDWINEFQRMGVSAPQPPTVHAQAQHQSPMNAQHSLAGPRPYDFFPQQAYQPQSMGAMQGHDYNAFAQAGHVPQFMENNTAAKTQAEQEFEDAMNEWFRQNEPLPEETVEQPDLNATVDLEATLDAADAQTQETPKDEKAEPPKSDPELARVAQQLVDVLADNQTEKFRNSEFLAVMRRIAASQLVVHGNNLVEPEKTPEIPSVSHVNDAAPAAP